MKSLKENIKARLSKGSTKFGTGVQSKAVLMLTCLPEVPNYHNAGMTHADGIKAVHGLSHCENFHFKLP